MTNDQRISAWIRNEEHIQMICQAHEVFRRAVAEEMNRDLPSPFYIGHILLDRGAQRRSRRMRVEALIAELAALVHGGRELRLRIKLQRVTEKGRSIGASETLYAEVIKDWPRENNDR